MPWFNNIDIIVNEIHHLEYMDASSLGLKLTRKVDDFNDLSKRFGDFTYTFSIPITKKNSIIFNYANAHGKINIFLNQVYDCQIYNNNKLLIVGQIELVGVNEFTFDVVVHSKLVEFIDAISGKTLNQLQFPTMVFDYEKTIVDWTNANYKNSDEALLQFPLVFYNTYFTPYSVYSGVTDMNRNTFVDKGDNSFQNFKYIINSIMPSGGIIRQNMFFYHQFPPAIYLVRIIQQIFIDAGWTINGSFFNNDNIKKIICPYIGDTGIYDRAGISGHTSSFSSPSKILQPGLFLPSDVTQIDFINAVINTFNLYFTIDVQNKIINFEEWNTFFGNNYNPYDMTNRIKRETMKLQKADNVNPSISFTASGNQLILGDNNVVKNYSNTFYNLQYASGNTNQYNIFFNKVGDNNSDIINILFGEPQMHRMYLYQDVPYNGGTGYGMQPIVVPMISKQKESDNGGKPFNGDTGQTSAYNTESTIQYQGTMSLYYYLGQSQCNIVQHNSKDLQNILYLNIATGYSATIIRTKIGFCSPFMITDNQINLQNFLNSITTSNLVNNIKTKDIIECSYLLTSNDMMVNSSDTYTKTDYSLVFDDSNQYHETLYTKFHKAKYDRYQNNNLLVADTIMTDFDWNELQIGRPILYYGEIYSLVNIDSYSPIDNSATITLIKQ